VVELVMYMPLLVFMIFVTLQLAFLFLGNQAAGAAAREAARVARSAGDAGSGAGSQAAIDAGVARGQEYITSVGHGLFDEPPTVQVAVVAGPGGLQVQARVKGTAVHLIPGVPGLKINKMVQGPLEEFRPDPGL
jgi:TadE-like protein